MNKALSVLNVIMGLVGQLIVTAGCSVYEVIPDDLEDRVSKSAAFEQIEQSPASYRGRLVVLGGEILSATRLPNKTRLEVLHPPLTDEYIPITEDRGRSKGRFDADDGGNEIFDPAILPEGTPRGDHRSSQGHNRRNRTGIPHSADKGSHQMGKERG